MNYIPFKGLLPNQIEVRPTDTKLRGKCALLLYINSRCAAYILDDTVGAYNWRMEYKDVGGKTYGRLSIRDPATGEWVYKEDTGSESNIESDKGLSSDIVGAKSPSRISLRSFSVSPIHAISGLV